LGLSGITINVVVINDKIFKRVNGRLDPLSKRSLIKKICGFGLGTPAMELNKINRNKMNQKRTSRVGRCGIFIIEKFYADLFFVRVFARNLRRGYSFVA
jgi:hypothetical protein